MQQIIDAILSADRDIREWVQLAERQRKELPGCDHLPCGPTGNGIAASRAVLVELHEAARLALSMRDEQVGRPEYEALAARLRAATRATEEGKSEGTREELERCAQMLDTYAPDLHPANEKGQIHFARAMMESTADVIRAFLATSPSPEQLAQRFHETYERLAPSFGYETRKESAKPWSDVPDQNKRLMVAVCAEILVGK